MVKEIPLGDSGKVALVDDEDHERVAALNWYPHEASNGRLWYAVTWIRVQQTPRKYKRLSMHRFLFNEPASEIDHVNHDGLDNRRANLRFASRSDNMANTRIRKGRRYKGAYRQGNRWAAICTKNYESFYLGMFATEEEAARAYDAKARELFGEFAYLNFPEVAA